MLYFSETWVCGGGGGCPEKPLLPAFPRNICSPWRAHVFAPHYRSQQDRTATRSRPRVRLCKPGAADTPRRRAASPFPWPRPRLARLPEGPARRLVEPSVPGAIAAHAAGPTCHSTAPSTRNRRGHPRSDPQPHAARRGQTKALRVQVSRGLRTRPGPRQAPSERSQGRDSERSPPEFATRRHPAFAQLARLRGAGWPSPGLRATPHGSRSSPLPARRAPSLPPPHPPGGPAGTELTPTASRRRPTPPEGRRPRARNVSDGAPRRASTLPRMPPPPGGGIHHRWRSYPGREGGRERLSVLTLLTEQTTALEGAASPHPPARSASAHARAGPAPGRAGRRAGHAGSGSFPLISLGNRAEGVHQPPGGSWANSGGCLTPGSLKLDPSPSQQLRSSRCAGPFMWGHLWLFFFSHSQSVHLAACKYKVPPPLLLLPGWLESPSQRCLNCWNKSPKRSLVPAWASAVGCSVSPATSWTWLNRERLLSKPCGGSPRLLTKAEALAGTTQALHCSFFCFCFKFLFTFQ